jgi:hypothetical protein
MGYKYSHDLAKVIRKTKSGSTEVFPDAPGGRKVSSSYAEVDLRVDLFSTSWRDYWGLEVLGILLAH